MGARFVKRESAPFELPVSFVREGGDTLDVVFVVDYKGPQALHEWVSRPVADPDSVRLCSVVRGWDLVDGDDVPIPVSAAAFAEVLDDYDGAVQTFLARYVAGCGEHREKN